MPSSGLVEFCRIPPLWGCTDAACIPDSKCFYVQFMLYLLHLRTVYIYTTMIVKFELLHSLSILSNIQFILFWLITHRVKLKGSLCIPQMSPWPKSKCICFTFGFAPNFSNKTFTNKLVVCYRCMFHCHGCSLGKLEMLFANVLSKVQETIF